YTSFFHDMPTSNIYTLSLHDALPISILPRTPTAEEAELYSRLDAASDEELPALLEQYRGIDQDIDEAGDLRIPLLRQLITIKLRDRKSTRLNSSHVSISYAVFCLKKK